MEELIAQYTGADEDERLTRQYITQLEFDTTMHKLADYLSPGTRICEIGAATGRYSLTFSALGCEVTSVELAPDQVDILRKKATAQQRTLDIFEGNACSMPFIQDDSQDVVVILGPLYHLKTEAERHSAIAEAERILKPGGMLAVAYISRYFVSGLFAQKFPELITLMFFLSCKHRGRFPVQRRADSLEWGILPHRWKSSIYWSSKVLRLLVIQRQTVLAAIFQTALITSLRSNIKPG